MRDLANKMAELKFEAPLAQFEESDEWGPLEYSSNANAIKVVTDNSITIKNNTEILKHDKNEKIDYVLPTTSPNNNNVDVINKINTIKENVDNFAEGFTGSLEDLVNTFDEKITKCFGNYEQSVEELAPVQVRSQDEIMSECQMWWTITGNFGNILPIDWSKTYARQMHVPTLKLNPSSGRLNYNDIQDLSSEDEAVANDLDMHALILGGLHTDTDPIKTAEEVIKEIDDIIDESISDEGMVQCGTIEKAIEILGSPLYEEKLRSLSITQLNELYMEMEVLIREFSETLISELAYRDELEYGKELKNTFISLLLAVQNRRRQFHVEKKKGKTQVKSTAATGVSTEPKYLTTVIPYNIDTAPENQTLQVLIKILKAINEDSPTVPTLLTDYILKVLCPT
uniref:Putative kinesin-associated fasciculation and elongation protein involved in axonal transport n=1 Tax=Culex tarsalis TaxID=7177 RepID=A0A1Q3FXE4_CULTA